MTIRAIDWREVDAAAMADLYDDGVREWQARLGWDTRDTWREIERSRRLGTVLGFVAIAGDGSPAGWTFALPLRGALQVGGLVARSEEATAALVERLCEAAAGRCDGGLTFFGLSGAPNLPGALAAAGLTVDRYDYLERALDADEPPALIEGVRAWRDGDTESSIDILASAYPGVDPLRPFAPQGARDDWREYVVHLVGTSGCGDFLPDHSFLLDGDRRGVVIVTRLSADVAHVAQIAVAPGARGQGLGRALLDGACDRAAATGHSRVTLMVGRRNHRARRLYESAGFRCVAEFTCAARVSRAGSRAWRPAAA